MASAATAVYDAAEALLLACNTSLSTPVARAFVSPGEPGADCNQLTVHTAALRIEPLAPSGAPLDDYRRQYPQVFMADLVVQLFRCVTITAAAPPAVRLAADAELLYTSVFEMWNGVNQAIKAATLFPDGCRSVRLTDGGPLASSGGEAGWQFGVTIQLDGTA